MTSLTYMMHASDKPRVERLLATLAPMLTAEQRWSMLSHCSTWTEDDIRGDWKHSCTMRSWIDGESTWRAEHQDVEADIPGLEGRTSYGRFFGSGPGLVDWLITGLMLMDAAPGADIGREAMGDVVDDFCTRASPARNLASSSLSQGNLDRLRCPEKVLVLSPENQREFDRAAGISDELEHAWAALVIRPDRAFCRKLRASASRPGVLSILGDLDIICSTDAEVIRKEIEGRNGIVVSREDDKALNGEMCNFIDTLVLKCVAGWRWRASANIVELARDLDCECEEIPMTLEGRMSWLLRIFHEGVRIEAEFHPPQSLLWQSQPKELPVPLFCGAELTCDWGTSSALT